MGGSEACHFFFKVELAGPQILFVEGNSGFVRLYIERVSGIWRRVGRDILELNYLPLVTDFGDVCPHW